MENYRKFALAVLALSLVALSAPAGDPHPTPTPRPTTLTAYAESITLKRPESIDADGRLTISSETIAEIARGGTLTEGRVVFGQSRAGSTANSSEKARWQSRVAKQRTVIDTITLKRARIKKDIDVIENGRMTPRAMARLQKAKGDLEFTDKELRKAKGDLARIIREARLDGAEPGWFR